MAAKSFQIALEAATNENNSEENWDRILEVCDYVKNGQVKPNELLDQILKRLKQTRKTKLQMNTLILFDAAVKNCGQQFHQLFTSRATMNVLVEIIDDTRTENIVRNRIGSLIKQWMDDPEFKDKAQYAMLSATYKKLTTEKGYTFIDGSNNQPLSTVAPTVATVASRRTQEDLLAKREEEEFAKAIALSMQEATQSKPQQTMSNSLYPSMQQSNSSNPTTTTTTINTSGNEKKAKALYDFEAAEDNEVTFKAGDILIITDDTDQHWWKGINNGVEGLFPANFVTKNLQQQVDSPNQSNGTTNKTINDLNQKQQRQNEIIKDQIVIDERFIDRCLAMLQNADPTGEIEADSNEMLMLEDTCYAMGPLIDHELEKVDRKHVQLEELNKNLREAMDLYHRLMEEGRIRAAQAKTNAVQLANQMYQQQSQVPPQPYYQVHPGLQQQQIPPQQQQQQPPPPMMYQPQQIYNNQIPTQTQPSMPYIPQQPAGAYYVDPNLQQHMMYSMPPNMMPQQQQQPPSTAYSETQ
ncbi:unnamed protein product [Adineta steineri]|uniref:Class E vacuolar protein-sorting machinery protein hse1 n=1 Tax=Adineta steineri TaxID=433720 RepID=A0A813RJ80_9BILA|nr:unnamed protein product [Adineta steineri]CAF0935946.1 unnamed protein product [Adineta steineri]